MRWPLIAAALLVAPTLALPAQQKPKLITEATYGLRMTGGADRISSFDGPSRFHVGIGVGAVKPVTSRVGLGAIGTFGFWGDAYIGVGPRLRVHASPKVAIDLTPSYLLYRDNPGQGHGVLDAAVMYRDAVGLSVQVASFADYVYDFSDPNNYTSTARRKTGVFAGLRLGSKPGRYGIGADLVALAGAFALYAIVCGSGSGCD